MIYLLVKYIKKYPFISSRTMTIITIDGNIGCCKTTILNHFHKNHKIAVDMEPVENWTPFLEKLYSEEKSSSYNFQIKVWMDRCWIQEKSNNILMFMERSPYFIKNVFVKKALEDKTITDDEYNILNNLHDKTNELWKPNAYIYLRSDPEMCLSRVMRRGRTCEKHVSIEYIKRLHELHTHEVSEMIKHNINVIIIDIENKSINDICNEILRNKNITSLISHA